MNKKLLLSAILIFSFYFAWLIPQVVVAIQMTSQAMEKNLGEPSSEVSRQADTHYGLAEMTDYVIQCESRADMSVIGKQGEIGILQFKPKTWLYLSERFNFKGSICNPQDQIKLFQLAIEDGLGDYWTCYKIYQDELQRENH